jgi:hypothetical protein
MSRARSNSLSALPSATTLSYDQEFPFLSERAGTDISRANPFRHSVNPPAEEAQSEAHPPGVDPPREDIEISRNNLEAPARWKQVNLLTCGKHS